MIMMDQDGRSRAAKGKRASQGMVVRSAPGTKRLGVVESLNWQIFLAAAMRFRLAAL
jgi:hypothetical protein